jgi:signal transduction histidine kinase
MNPDHDSVETWDEPMEGRTSSVPCESPEVVTLEDVVALRAQLNSERGERRRAECFAKVQTDAVQLALDLLVREPDIEGFFGAFTKTLVEDCESYACGVWLIDDDHRCCDLWMAYLDDRIYTVKTADWDTLTLPRDSMAKHLYAYRSGWHQSVVYTGDDPRLPDAVQAFNRNANVQSLAVVPLVLGGRNLGWMGLASTSTSDCEVQWRLAVLEAMARQATLALHQSRLSEQRRLEERRKAILEERNRLARDIHDNLAQGFAAILMQLQAAQREAGTVAPAVAASIDTAVHLARTHMTEARRSVSALRPNVGEGEDVAAALKRIADVGRRTTAVPIDLNVDEMPRFGGGVEREIIGIAQEALTNALRHSRARRITIRASTVQSIGFRLSVADDGRGIPKDIHSGGFGMTSMRERADRIGASLTIVTAPRKGTEVVLAWEPASLPTQVHVAS